MNPKVLKKTLVPVTIIIVLGFLVFSNALFNSFVMDDYPQITNNLTVHSLKNIPYFFTTSSFGTGGGPKEGIYYKPLMTSIFSLIYTFFGSSVFPYHFSQLIIHLINSLLIYQIYKNLFQPKNRGVDYLALFASLIFLVHPLNVESVVYVSALQDTLFTFFGLIAFLLIITKPPASVKVLLLVLLMLFLSLLSKDTGILFVAIIFVYLILFYQKSYSLKFLVSSGGLLAIYAYLRFSLAQIDIAPANITAISKIPLNARLLNIPKIITYYLSNFVYPKNLSVSQGWKVEVLNFNHFFLPLMVLAFFFFFVIFLASQIYQNNSKQFKLSLFFLIWFILGLIIHLQILPLDSTVADRWFYFPMIGLLGFLAITLKSINLKLYKIPLFLACLLIISLLSIRTIIRNTNWKDSLTLSFHDLYLSENNYFIENDLGYELVRRGKLDEAKIHLEKSIDLYPTPVNWNNMGIYYLKKGDNESAIQAFQNSISLGSFYVPYQNLAMVMVLHSDPQKTQTFIINALEKFPKNHELWMYRALIEDKLGHTNQALAAAQKSVQLNPTQLNKYIYEHFSKGLPVNIKFEF